MIACNALPVEAYLPINNQWFWVAYTDDQVDAFPSCRYGKALIIAPISDIQDMNQQPAV